MAQHIYLSQSKIHTPILSAPFTSNVHSNTNVETIHSLRLACVFSLSVFVVIVYFHYYNIYENDDSRQQRQTMNDDKIIIILSNETTATTTRRSVYDLSFRVCVARFLMSRLVCAVKIFCFFFISFFLLLLLLAKAKATVTVWKSKYVYTVHRLRSVGRSIVHECGVWPHLILLWPGHCMPFFAIV